MRILADADIPYVEESFGLLGHLRTLPASALTADAVADADALLVRSVTRVDARLLAASTVQFVGTATTGVDHIDRAYLRKRGITFADAAGCNANAVAEYVAAALLHLAASDRLTLPGARLGIVGLGNVGRRVARMAGALGLRCVVNDPPRARSTAEPLYRPLDEVLACDVVTLHVPLERQGLDPTYRLADEDFFAAMPPHAVFVNTSRGAVVDEAALWAALEAGQIRDGILDVWENEPRVNPALVDACAVATPHIAGHSLDAKLAATRRLFEALRDWLGATAAWRSPLAIADRQPGVLRVGGSGLAPAAAAATQATGILDYCHRLRAVAALDENARARAFTELRSQLPTRREFQAWRVAVEDVDEEAAALIGRLGFRVERETATASGVGEDTR